MSLQKSYIHMENDDKIRAKLNSKTQPVITQPIPSPAIEEKITKKYDQKIQLLQKRIEVLQMEMQMSQRGSDKDKASIGYQ